MLWVLDEQMNLTCPRVGWLMKLHTTLPPDSGCPVGRRLPVYPSEEHLPSMSTFNTCFCHLDSFSQGHVTPRSKIKYCTLPWHLIHRKTWGILTSSSPLSSAPSDKIPQRINLLIKTPGLAPFFPWVEDFKYFFSDGMSCRVFLAPVSSLLPVGNVHCGWL